MKNVISLYLLTLFSSIYGNAFAQGCFPNANFGSQSFGLYPSGPMQMDCSGTNSSKTLVTLADTIYNDPSAMPLFGDSLAMFFDAMRITEVTGLPSGLMLETDVMSTADPTSPYGIWENSGTYPNIIAAVGCVNITGSQPDWNAAASGGIGGNGIYELVIVFEFRVDTVIENESGLAQLIFAPGNWTGTVNLESTIEIELRVNESGCLGDLSLMTEVTPDDPNSQTCDGTASVEVFYGTPPYLFAFSNGATGSASTSGLCTGFYEVEVTDANGNTGTGEFAIASQENTFTNFNPSQIAIGTDTLYSFINTCDLDYNLPIDSFSVTNTVVVGADTVVAEWLVYQLGQPYTIQSILPFFGGGSTVLSLLVWCENGRSEVGVFQLYDLVDMPTGIKDQEIVSFEVYPNPSDGVFFLELEKPEPLAMRLVDMTGKLLKQLQLNGSTLHQISLEAIPKGMYILELESETGRSYRRLIKK